MINKFNIKLLTETLKIGDSSCMVFNRKGEIIMDRYAETEEEAYIKALEDLLKDVKNKEKSNNKSDEDN